MVSGRNEGEGLGLSQGCNILQVIHGDIFRLMMIFFNNIVISVCAKFTLGPRVFKTGALDTQEGASEC